MFKYLMMFPKMLGLFKDTTAAYKESEGTAPTPWMSQRFIGSIITGIGALLAMLKVVEVPSETLNGLAQSVPSIVDGIIIAWGQIISALGAYKAQKRAE